MCVRVFVSVVLCMCEVFVRAIKSQCGRSRLWKLWYFWFLSVCLSVSHPVQATHEVVHQDSKAQLEAQEKALQNIKTKLFSDQSSAQQKIQMDQKSNFQKLSKLEQEAAQDTLVMNKDAKENVTDVQGQFVGKLGAARSAFKALMAHIHGLAANTSEWRDMVEDAVKGERAAAHRQALVESNTRLEQQSMLDTRYRELASTVQMKVDGLQNSTQDEMMAYMDESKKAAQKILKSVSMSNDEKLKALEKVTNVSNQMLAHEFLHESCFRSGAW